MLSNYFVAKNKNNFPFFIFYLYLCLSEKTSNNS